MKNQQELLEQIEVLAKKHGVPFRQKQKEVLINLLAIINKSPDNDEKSECLENQVDLVKSLAYLLKSIPTGQTYCAIYHKLASLFVADIFHEDLTNPLVELQGSKGHKRFDLMLYNRAQAGFWSDMRKTHQISHVIFEFKNGKKIDYREFAKQVSDYSQKNRAIILVTRIEPGENMFYELSDLYKKIENFLPLPISYEELCIAYFLKQKGSSPSNIFEKPYLKLQAA
ncbi:MAG TPA: hypothetical protein VMW42_04995 [Desulfatiglandales bacterium]|nr:hypothetical protein [Desulfatiglandales bacterium]